MIRILIADDIKILRECLSIAIGNEPGFEVVGCAGDGKEAIELSLKSDPDVILMDLNMPVCTGYDAIREIKRQNPEIKILVLTVEDEEKNMADAFKCGADGYVMKDIGHKELTGAIMSAYNGVKYMNEGAFSIGSETVRADEKRHGDIYLQVNFTAREKEVLSLVTEGMTNEEIAEVLGISAGRVRNIVADLIAKCMVKNRTQLAVIAIKIGMLI